MTKYYIALKNGLQNRPISDENNIIKVFIPVVFNHASTLRSRQGWWLLKNYK